MAARAMTSTAVTQLILDNLHHLGMRKQQHGVINRAVGWGSWTMWMTLRYINHPMSKGRRMRSITSMWAWQIWRRTVKGAVVVHLPEGTDLICPPWSHMASSYIAVGFHEYREIMFALDLLRPGDLFVDVGANLGYYSMMAARRNVSCLAFEPTKRTRVVIDANASLNDVQNLVEIVPFALADFDGHTSFTTNLESSDHIVVGSDEVTLDAMTQVQVRTFDGVLREREKVVKAPSLIKIDAEGFDLAVLRGGEGIINDSHPAILIEIWDGGHEERAWLEAHGYSVYRYEPDTRTPIAIPPSFRGQGMFIAIHNDRLKDTQSRLAEAQRLELRHPSVRWR